MAAAVAELPGRIVADVDTASAGQAAAEAGAAAVATTLSGYTGDDTPAGPDLALVAELAQELDVPVLAEGRYGTQEEVWAALGAGAFAVVVGTAITDPEALTRRLASRAAAGSRWLSGPHRTAPRFPRGCRAASRRARRSGRSSRSCSPRCRPARRCRPSASWPSATGWRA